MEPKNKYKPRNIDEYLETVSPHHRDSLISIRKIINETAADAQEVISYGMPAFKYFGMLVGFASFKNHCSLFLWKKGSIDQFKHELEDFNISEGTIRFTPDHPIPEELVAEIVSFRIKENLDRHQAKNKKKG